jgi:hypothetical protein
MIAAGVEPLKDYEPGFTQPDQVVAAIFLAMLEASNRAQGKTIFLCGKCVHYVAHDACQGSASMGHGVFD